MKRPPSILALAILISACTISFDGSAGRPLSFEVIEEPVAFYFDTDPRDRDRLFTVAEKLEPNFPEMSWRIGDYEPSPDDGLVIVVEERHPRNVSSESCGNCLRLLTVFLVFDRGRQIATEEFENCGIYHNDGDCFAIRRLVSTIDQARAETRRSNALN